MAGPATPTTGWKRPAAPDRHPSKRPVALPLCHFDVRRPASTVRIHPIAAATIPTI
jgi:hypothetical protein